MVADIVEGTKEVGWVRVNLTAVLFCRHVHGPPSLSPFFSMSSLQGYVDRRVLLVLQDGRAIVVSFS